jgi:hypothetical protein
VRKGLFFCSALLPLLLAQYCPVFGESEKQVRQVTIRSGWGGLGNSQDVTVTIHRTQTGFQRDGKSVDPRLLQALVSAMETPRIASPEMGNLGITESWLKAQVRLQKPESFAHATKTTAGQHALFETKFTDLRVVGNAIPDLWHYVKFDDYPGVRVLIDFEDDSKIEASTHSYYVFMIPWRVAGQDGETFNADISRAVSALLPPKTVNKERLAGSDLPEELTKTVMNSMETEWNIKGTEEMVGDALAQLRAKYQLVAAEITPYHHPEYGTATYKGEPEEKNLHALLRKPEFPPNVVDAVVLRDDRGRVEGIDAFLANAARYESLALSVPWLNQFIHDHPKAFFRISYVHDASFGDKAMQTFEGDMKKREREDLIAQVRSQQSQIALLMVGITYSESYWLVFPDKHLLLWRYTGPSGLLKWTPADFGEGECADYRMNNGGCSGREVDQAGNLKAEGKPRDESCVAAWQAKHPERVPVPEALFEITDRGRSGLIDRSGRIIVPECFDSVSDSSEGLVRFERDGKFGFLDFRGRVAIQPQFPWAEDFHEGLAHVQVSGSQLGYDGRWGYIDQTGKVVIAPEYPRMMGDDDGVESRFQEGLALVEPKSESIPPRKGYINKAGKVVIPARFTYASPFSEGLAAVTESEAGDTGWGFIDRSGNWVIPPTFEWATDFQLGLAAVNRKQNCGYVDRTGSLIIPVPAPAGKQNCWSSWGEFGDGLSRQLIGTQYGFIDKTGKITIQPQFNLTFGFSEGLAAVQIGKKWGYVDTAGKMAIELRDLSFAKPFHNGLARVGFGKDGWGYLDRPGRTVWHSAPTGEE